jgi:CheY-like chemotaxis protein
LPKPVESLAILDRALASMARYIDEEQRAIVMASPPGAERELLCGALQGTHVRAIFADSRDALVQELSSQAVDALVLADDVPGISPELIEATLVARDCFAPLPVLLSTAGDGPPERWERVQERFYVQHAPTGDRLLDLCVAALHLDTKRLPAQSTTVLNALHASQHALQGVKALIVDDDMRNIFALATIMEDLGMRHVWADNGREAIRQVESDHEIGIVMMDIMMPEMDGLTTMREIRKRPVGKTLPIIAVTAKAMKGDREKCIEAGAWDYLSKPVNRDDLVAVLHAWLHH